MAVLTARLSQLFQSDTVTIFPQLDCYNCPTVTLLGLLHSDTVMIVLQ